tara:strand:+ start:2835 stop:3122 length:288 start_codon:yes stop_codon:yes gene_type:complete
MNFPNTNSKDLINFLSANNGELEITTEEGLIYNTAKLETIAKIITNHTMPIDGVLSSSSMDFAKEYGFKTNDAASKLWEKAVDLVIAQQTTTVYA